MIIQKSSIELSSLHQKTESSIQRESWQYQKDRLDGLKSSTVPQSLPLDTPKSYDFVTLSSSSSLQQGIGGEEQWGDFEDDEDQAVMRDLNMRILRAFFAKVSSRNTSVSRQLSLGQEEGLLKMNEDRVVGQETLQFQRETLFIESESLSFQTKGTIITGDGAVVDFSAAFVMDHQFIKNLKIESAQELKDPLILNFSGNIAQLSKNKFLFDIDADGTVEVLSFVEEGSGFLVYDKNSDGQINNGTELFGALQGDGFQELSLYDDDGNGWIDEKDAVFAKLQVWMKDESGKDIFATLSEKHVGALSLGNIETPFSLYDSESQEQGMLRATGIFVTEEYTLGTMQQVDLLV